MTEPAPESKPASGDSRARDRAVIARIAAAERWARTSDRAAATEPARRGLRARFEREADPDGVLDAAERSPGPRPHDRAHAACGPTLGAAAQRHSGTAGQHLVAAPVGQHHQVPLLPAADEPAVGERVLEPVRMHPLDPAYRLRISSTSRTPSS